MDSDEKKKEEAKKLAARRKRNGQIGNMYFSSFLAVYAAMFAAAFQGMIPWQSWEIMNLQQQADWAKAMKETAWIPVVLSVLYVVLCFGGQALMKNHRGFDKELRKPLAYWSIFLAAFSVAGSLRTVPMLFKILMERGVVHLVCGDTRFDWLEKNPASFWTLVFCLSKIPELVDTAFIVLRKKELITLHWYHHFTVMLFCWQAWVTCSVNGIIYAAMNLTVHGVMYTFYALTALGYRPTTFAMFITMGQIVQMIVGTAVTTYVTIDKLIWHPVKSFDFSLTVPEWFFDPYPHPDGGECHVTSGNALAGLVMYGSYLVLFVLFFISTYCKKGGKGE